MADFLNSFNSSLRAGALIQGIYLRGEQRKLQKQERRMNEFSRGIVALEKQYGSANPAEWGEEGLAQLQEHMNAYPENLRRPNGDARIRQFVPTGGGIAAVVDVDDGQGNVSTGPITKRGSRDGDDEVVVLNNTAQLTDPVMANYQQAKFNATVKSQHASDRINAQADVREQNASFETLNEYLNDPSGDGTANQAGATQAAPANAQPAGAAPVAPAQEPAAQTPAPVAVGGTPPPAAATPQGTFNIQGGANKTWGRPEIEGLAEEIANENGVDPNIMKAVYMTESGGGDPRFMKSKTGADGVGQITGIALKEVNDNYGTNYTRAQVRTDDRVNMDVATKLMKRELELHDGNVEQAVAAYNGGRGHLARAGGDYRNTRKETAEYVPKVLAYLSGSGDAQAAAPSPEPEAPVPGSPRERVASTRRQRRLERKAKAQAPAPGTQGEVGQDSTPEQRIKDIKVAFGDSTPEGKAEIAALQQQIIDEAQPQDAAEEAVVAEISASETPETEEQAAEAVKTVEEIKPAKRLNKKQRDAIYSLHRINPGQFPIKDVISALKTGRLTASSAKTFTDAAGRVGVYEDGQVKYLQASPEGERVIAAEVSKKESDAADAARKTITGAQDQQLDRTIKVTDHIVNQAENLHGGDPELKARIRDKVNVTLDTLGLNEADQTTPTIVNKSAKIQSLFEADNGPKWWNLWMRDAPEHNDYTFGAGVLNAPGNPYNAHSNDNDTMEQAGNWYNDNYMKPLRKEFGDAMPPQKQASAAYVATELAKQGMTKKDALHTAGSLVQHQKYANATPADILNAIKKFRSNQQR